MPVIAGVLAFAALCSALWLFVSQPGTGSLFGLVAKRGASSVQSAAGVSSGTSVAASAGSAQTGVSMGGGSSDSTVNTNATLDSVPEADNSLKNAAWFDNAVFVGDSITGGISGYKLAKSGSVLYTNGMSAASAYKTKVKVGSDSETLLQALKDNPPKYLFILLGLNDLSFSGDADDFATHYETLIEKIQKACPDTTVYVQSIFPVTATYAQNHSSYENSRIDEFNTALKKVCTTDKVKFVNVASILKDANGNLPSAMTSDGYNLKARYYYNWLNYLYDNR